ncbi:heterodisulfide reductase-related iron-sulfur binding cluster [Novosphingobium sp.]|uniref:heterodisulfide reductase-related iron-sulfur binding cluster n=1 Tax=Novosphingobium sp. TaxID=1874826 RepID=UPI0027346E99|nr:heterodisulfide reductase-related iron-sulfur binding cluster [Novosphingobium sp.]MDP3907168.1 heterodisulfide reductase-related iron-sulfur binding cluster [Novosphingobium sp.]
MEGSLEAPTRHPIPWQDESWYDEAALDAELRRVYDICHGCRRCFNLCDSFPILFDAIDEAPNEEVEDLTPVQLKAVVDACTLCDMCFMTKCPYVPPHSFDLDFPHLMLRYRAVEHRKGQTSFADTQLAEMGRNGKLGSALAGLANWATDQDNGLTRPIIEKVAGIDRRAHLPPFLETPLVNQAAGIIPAPNPDGPVFGKKVAVYAGCHDNFNDGTPGLALIKVLAHNGVRVRIEHPDCCAMPKLENGDMAAVASAAQRISAHFAPLIADGWDIVPLTTSCALMLKFEWPLIEVGNDNVTLLAKHSFDVSEYIVALAKDTGLAPIKAMPASIAVHFACHARAQNMGPKAMEMLRLIPEAKPALTERCSGHGGKWGIFKENFDRAVKVGKPAARNLVKTNPDLIVSECPLAGPHLKQVITANGGEAPERIGHPIEIVAKAYGL